MTLQEQIIAHARECIGTPFQHQARVKGLGMDCVGLAIYVVQSLGLPHVDQRGYPRTPYQGLIRTALDAQPCLQKIDRTDMQVGDVLLMRFGREPQHVAICAGETIIHSYSQIGRVVEHGFTDEWRRRVTDVYRVIA